MTMPGHVTGAALVTACEAGLGTIVLTEGDDKRDDPFFYGRWFGDKALAVSFFPQNGWPKVIEGVAELQRQLPARRVYGIIDRDFASDEVLAAQDCALPPEGILRTRRYTLENYLLEAPGWFALVKLLHRDAPPVGWATIADVERRIEDAYRRCIRLGAWNYVVHVENVRTGRDGWPYREHPDSVPAGAETQLAAWGHGRGAPEPLDEQFRAHCDRLSAMSPVGWPQWITGKAVLRALHETLPFRLPLQHLLTLYIERRPQPPDELAALIARLI